MKKLLIVAVVVLTSGCAYNPAVGPGRDVGPYVSSGAALYRACSAVTLTTDVKKTGPNYAKDCEVRGVGGSASHYTSTVVK